MKTVADLSGVAQILQAELQQRFVKYTAPGSEEHNAVMLAATALDARYRVLLNPIQVDSAKQMLLSWSAILYLLCINIADWQEWVKTPQSR